MIILDHPYVSDLLKETIREHGIPALCSGDVHSLGLNELDLLGTGEAVSRIREGHVPRIYTNSENAIGWITDNLSFTDLPEKIELFKNKVSFRRLLHDMYPYYMFQEIRFNDLCSFNYEAFKKPFILKPAVGFFSMGVFKISSQDDFENACSTIESDFQKLKGIYPETVFDAGSFIAEDIIEGDEFAIDAYFNSEGEPVIVNIMQHLFASDHDVSDRVYITSDDIIRDNVERFTSFLQEIGSRAGLSNFPCHAEVRIDSEGKIYPIEINPMRFGGWCTTADLAIRAWEFNPYLSYLHDEKPDWEVIIKGKEDYLYSIVVLDNSTGMDGSEIKSFDYDAVIKTFQKPFEVRKIDYKEYPVFGFIYAQHEKDNYNELHDILISDLREYVTF